MSTSVGRLFRVTLRSIEATNANLRGGRQMIFQEDCGICAACSGIGKCSLSTSPPTTSLTPKITRLPLANKKRMQNQLARASPTFNPKWQHFHPAMAPDSTSSTEGVGRKIYSTSASPSSVSWPRNVDATRPSFQRTFTPASLRVHHQKMKRRLQKLFRSKAKSAATSCSTRRGVLGVLLESGLEASKLPQSQSAICHAVS